MTEYFPTGDTSDRNSTYTFKDEKKFIKQEIARIDKKLRSILILVEQLLDDDVDNLTYHIDQLNE
jgi:hypothetical protein